MNPTDTKCNIKKWKNKEMVLFSYDNKGSNFLLCLVITLKT